MNKGRLIKTVAAVSALVMLTSVTAFAKPGAFEMGNGKIYLDGETQSPFKRASTGTIPGDGESSLTMLITTLDDGEEDVTRDGPSVGNTRIIRSWEYADGYKSSQDDKKRAGICKWFIKLLKRNRA